MRATGKSRHQVNVSISIQLEFYYNEYDWGVIYREIGGQNNKFYKVRSCAVPAVLLKTAVITPFMSSDPVQPAGLRC